jgi:hypothetical protein
MSADAGPHTGHAPRTPASPPSRPASTGAGTGTEEQKALLATTARKPRGAGGHPRTRRVAGGEIPPDPLSPARGRFAPRKIHPVGNGALRAPIPKDARPSPRHPAAAAQMPAPSTLRDIRRPRRLRTAHHQPQQPERPPGSATPALGGTRPAGAQPTSDIRFLG